MLTPLGDAASERVRCPHCRKFAPNQKVRVCFHPAVPRLATLISRAGTSQGFSSVDLEPPLRVDPQDPSLRLQVRPFVGVRQLGGVAVPSGVHTLPFFFCGVLSGAGRVGGAAQS